LRPDLGHGLQLRYELAQDRRLRGRLEMVLDYARVIGQRQGENPARWKGHLDHLLPARSKVAKVEHHPALANRELPGFLRELHQ
jgi:hypothetical protein